MQRKISFLIAFVLCTIGAQGQETFLPEFYTPAGLPRVVAEMPAVPFTMVRLEDARDWATFGRALRYLPQSVPLVVVLSGDPNGSLEKTASNERMVKHIANVGFQDEQVRSFKVVWDRSNFLDTTFPRHMYPGALLVSAQKLLGSGYFHTENTQPLKAQIADIKDLVAGKPLSTPKTVGVLKLPRPMPPPTSEQEFWAALKQESQNSPELLEALKLYASQAMHFETWLVGGPKTFRETFKGEKWLSPIPKGEITLELQYLGPEVTLKAYLNKLGDASKGNITVTVLKGWNGDQLTQKEFDFSPSDQPAEQLYTVVPTIPYGTYKVTCHISLENSSGEKTEATIPFELNAYPLTEGDAKLLSPATAAQQGALVISMAWEEFLESQRRSTREGNGSIWPELLTLVGKPLPEGYLHWIIPPDETSNGGAAQLGRLLQPTLLEFTAISCPYCRILENALVGENLTQVYCTDDGEKLSVNGKLKKPTLSVSLEDMKKAFRIQGWPALILIKPNGKEAIVTFVASNVKVAKDGQPAVGMIGSVDGETTRLFTFDEIRKLVAH